MARTPGADKPEHPPPGIVGRGPRVEVRVTAATTESLEDAIEEGRFREDLYYRLNGWPIVLPPLRERRIDVEVLARHFLERFSKENQLPTPEVPAEVMELLTGHDW